MNWEYNSARSREFLLRRGGEINDRSLVIIVGNLLQNAIEALEEKGIAPGASVDFSISTSPAISSSASATMPAP